MADTSILPHSWSVDSTAVQDLRRRNTPSRATPSADSVASIRLRS